MLAGDIEDNDRNTAERCTLNGRAGDPWIRVVHPDTMTFLGVEACDLTAALPVADAILFGASDATPYLAGQTSHAAKAPDVIRRALHPTARRSVQFRRCRPIRVSRQSPE
jgi:hypothetical protein